MAFNGNGLVNRTLIVKDCNFNLARTGEMVFYEKCKCKVLCWDTNDSSWLWELTNDDQFKGEQIVITKEDFNSMMYFMMIRLDEQIED